MSETEIALVQDYLRAARHDPVAALIRSVKDLARARRDAARATTDVAAIAVMAASATDRQGDRAAR